MTARNAGVIAGSAEGFTRWITRGPKLTRRATRARLGTVLRALGAEPPTARAALLSQTEQALAAAGSDALWLALAVLTATLPEPTVVERAVRSSRLDGPLAALDEALRGRGLIGYLRHRRELESCDVMVVTDRVIVDLHNTASATIATGIQRVARETAWRWERDHNPMFVEWHPRRPALLQMPPPKLDHAWHGVGQDHAPAQGRRTIVVPWRCSYVLPELMAELPRVGALHGLFRYSGNASAAIGFDCVPLTVPETVAAEPVIDGFAAMLAAFAHADRVAAISESAAQEFRGWRAMLAGTGLRGPQIAAIGLPAEVGTPSAAALEAARESFLTADLPMVLVVGSHEPRKNHLVLLHAAELLWRDGVSFSLEFIGGNAWRSEPFREQVEQLQRAGRPVNLRTAVPDDDLWAAYRLARCTVFPSLNEGFGLPVAESLASGTPVITSEFGSMREIAADGGAILVDPRSAHDIADALGRLIADDGLHAALAAEARQRRHRSWDEYAAEAWNYLVSGNIPERTLDPPLQGTL